MPTSGDGAGDAASDRTEAQRGATSHVACGTQYPRFDHDETRDRAAAAHDHAADRMTFAVVTVQQPVGSPALHGCGELTAQVGRVLHAGIHPLRAGRGVHMGGVADEEDSPHLVMRNLTFVAVEA